MVDVLLLIAFLALPIAAWLVSRSLLFVAVWLGLGIGVVGNVVQGTIALGAAWDVRGLQLLLVAVMAAVVVLGWWRRRSGSAGGSVVRQLVTIVVPALVIGVYLLAMRLLAPDNPGPLSAVGYLINHPQAEDNAKWLHLSAQLADGRDIAFSGYAGGPLLLVMAGMAALIAVLSSILLGGVNEVAVAANTVVGTQFLLIALVPFAFAVFAEKKVLLRAGSPTCLRAGGAGVDRDAGRGAGQRDGHQLRAPVLAVRAAGAGRLVRGVCDGCAPLVAVGGLVDRGDGGERVAADDGRGVRVGVRVDGVDRAPAVVAGPGCGGGDPRCGLGCLVLQHAVLDRCGPLTDSGDRRCGSWSGAGR